ncbi:MAG: T9SS type A sorting domain-containing protein [candidate division Zixibacteria bacterium]|nr:T9SS type A sorting domain-containing protein [candidate division Zixibacteria bacterium]
MILLYNNRFILIIVVLCIFCGKLFAKETSSSPIVIHYGLNDSHSRSWVQENNEGIVGVSYFQRCNNCVTEGTLIYKTINPDGSEHSDSITTGNRLEKSVLLYDSLSNPHIFVAKSDNSNQAIIHYSKDNQNQWNNETIVQFYNEGGRFIYELSADTGPDGSFHLLILKTRSDIDSDDFMDAWLNSYLYHLTNVSGIWRKQLIHNYNMAYTYDMYVKSSSRQDIKIDSDGFVHVIFSEQINSNDDPSRLRYVTNKTGVWKLETALNYDYGIRDDAGWFPSLCLDRSDVPYITCMYINRVYTYSAVYCKLYYLERLGYNNWKRQIIADKDDGYYGGDGRKYTGGLTHLVFDSNNKPHIIFSDIASTHYPILNQCLAVGNIRYGTLVNNNWEFTTIYHQPRPIGFYDAVEMFGMCLIVSDKTGTIRVIGQEMEISGEYQYTCKLVDFEWPLYPTDLMESNGETLPDKINLFQNYPNPFNPITMIEFDLPAKSHVSIEIFNILGQKIETLINKKMGAGNYNINWDGTDMASGIYFYRLETGDFSESKKMILLK